MKKPPEDKLNQLKKYLKFLNEIGIDNLDSLCESGPRFWLMPQIEKAILSCRRCPLAETRTKAVPGEGDWQAELMFVGEAPGEEEDKQGRPFVGRAGQLLTKIIEAMTFRREEVFITNVVKCRPPQNRIPRQEEVQKCSSYLEAQIRLIKPKVIVALGKVAADFFVPGNLGMGELRGHFFYCESIPIMPTYHPAYVLRNEGRKEVKQRVWQDMKKVMLLLGRR